MASLKEGKGQTTTPEQKFRCLMVNSTTHGLLTVFNEPTPDPRCIDGGAMLQTYKKDGTMVKYCIAKKRDPKTKEKIHCEVTVPIVAHMEQASDGDNELVSSS